MVDSFILETDGIILKPGHRLQVAQQVNSDGKGSFHRAEIMSTRLGKSGRSEYYVHFIDFNKRLDEWVDVDRMDLSTVELKAEAGDRMVPPAVGKKTPVTKKRRRDRDRDRRSRGRPPKSTTLEESDEVSRPSSILSSASDVGSTTASMSGIPQVLSKAQEIEKLRHGGSMTQRLEEVARVKNIDCIEMGAHLVRTWYFSPYPQEICGTTGDSTIYICEFCLGYFGKRPELRRHRQKCTVHHPPGTEIYRSGVFSFWELDGHRQKSYCRNLCLLSKLFLDHKTLFYDVDPFLFYVLTENDAKGCHLIGYFSKEKESADEYNVACILTLPQHQRRGYGKYLIEFSYELTKREGRVGSPEKPLSDLGLLSYRSYWSEKLVALFMDQMPSNEGGEERRVALSIEQISKQTGFTCEDILHTLQAMDALRYKKGQHVIVLGEKHIADYIKNSAKTNRLKVDPKALHWTPPVFTPAQLRFL